MPTYTYQCQKETCGHMIDAFRKIVDRDTPPVKCENCGETLFKRVQQPVGFVLNGKDWHNTEYNKRGPRR